MLQLKCTQKVFQALGLAPPRRREPREADTLLGHWYVNLFTVDRRKTFLFMNERTLLSFVVFGIKKSNVQSMPTVFLRGLVQVLELEGFGQAEVDRALAGCEDMELVRTDSPRLLGNMNDLASMYRHFILWEGGLSSCNLNSIITRLNRTPQRNLGWGYSIEMTRELLTQGAGRAS